MFFPHMTRSLILVLLLSSVGLSPSVTAATFEVPDTLATPIQEERFVTLGGIEQWITIRGANRANPVLLIVHGGPGDAQSDLRSAYAVYEKDFTIVQWDQRGAGHTYAKNPNSPPEPERVVSDGIEIARYLCEYLAKKKIVLLGHSWGSYLGIGMVQRDPELFAAYVGTGQVGSWRANIQAQFDFLLAKARAANDRKRVEQLEAIGTPDPNDPAKLLVTTSHPAPYTRHVWVYVPKQYVAAPDGRKQRCDSALAGLAPATGLVAEGILYCVDKENGNNRLRGCSVRLRAKRKLHAYFSRQLTGRAWVWHSMPRPPACPGQQKRHEKPSCCHSVITALQGQSSFMLCTA